MKETMMFSLVKLNDWFWGLFFSKENLDPALQFEIDLAEAKKTLQSKQNHTYQSQKK